MEIIFIFLLIVFIILMIINLRIVLNQREWLENYDELLDTQWKLEDIMIKAEASKELPVITVAKINKVLFPTDANQGK